MLKTKNGVLWLADIAFIPSIHGRVAFARETRRVFLDGRFPTVAVELPESLAESTFIAIERLPLISIVTYQEADGTHCVYPIDPCDSIIEALRLGLSENCQLEFIDCDVEDFQRRELALPDSYAVSRIGLARFYQAVKPALPPRVLESQDDIRERHMARRLLEIRAAKSRRLPILCVLGMAHLDAVASYVELGLREGIEALELAPLVPPPFDVRVGEVAESSLYPILGELPYTTYLYELQRGTITLEEFEAVDKIKELLLEARDRYHQDHPAEHEKISLTSFQNLLKLVRNLCLLGKRLTPDLYEMVVAAKGIAGNDFALEVMRTARQYPPAQDGATVDEAESEPEEMVGNESGSVAPEDEAIPPEGLDEGASDAEPPNEVEPNQLAVSFDGTICQAKKRYVDEAKIWKKVQLRPRPPRESVSKWQTAWDPHRHCSWTPEDVLIENFASHVRSRALLDSGLAQERLEEFTTSFKDGIHLRETIRNLHLGKIIVKETPQPRGTVGSVVILYEPPNPQRFPWKVTWFPEFEWESVLALYATDFTRQLIGPGIAQCLYGGQLFVRPRQPIHDIWEDESLAEARDDAERLLFAGVKHSPEVFVALVAASPPTTRMKQYAERHARRIIYLPLASFSRSTIEKLRRFHVLNGKPVRSWAQRFIR